MSRKRDDILGLLTRLPGRIQIAAHIDPDGDTMGAAAAMAQWLKNEGREVSVFCRHKVPQNYEWAFDQLLTQELDQQAEILLCLDCAAADRLGEAQELLGKVPVTLCIDHHYSNEGFCSYNYIDAAASSTCEIITQLFLEKGIEWGEAIAQALYIGLVTDSGQFSFDSVRPETLTAAAENLKRGAPCALINKRIFRTRSLAKTRLIGEALAGIKTFNGGKIVLLHTDKAMMARCGAKYEDGENLINYGIEIPGVEIAVMLKQQSAAYKASIRTEGSYNAADIAARMGGGGHGRAAGCTLSPIYEEALAAMLKALEAEIGTTLERDF